jgi:hypothetical protein
VKLKELINSEMPYVMKITKTRYNPFSKEDRLRRQIGEYFGVEHSPCIDSRARDECGNLIRDNQGREIVLYEACKTRRRDAMQFPEDWEGENGDPDIWCFERCVFPLDVSVFNEQQWEIYLQKRKSDGKRRDYFGHPENEKIFLEKYPEILELVKGSIIVMSKAQ